MRADDAEVAELRALADRAPASAAEPYRSLTSIPEVLAFAYTDAQAEHGNGLDVVELLVAALKLDRSSRRAAARTLSKLQYPSELVDLVRGKR